jgi:hypothetical protein
MNFKPAGYIISILFGLELAYLLSGVVSGKSSLSDVAWHLAYSAAMLALGVWLVIRKPKSSKSDTQVKGSKK